MSSTKDFRVAIVGGGMCGIACAVSLSLKNIHADVFEAAPRFGQVGAGVGFGLNAIKALDELGILKPVMEKTDNKKTLRSFTFVSGYGQHEVVYNYAEHSLHFGVGIYRPTFLDALLPLLHPNSLHLNKKCTRVIPLESGAYNLYFEDGTVHETDLVIGADGIKSAVRSSVTKASTSDLVFTNTVAYRNLMDLDSLYKAGIKTKVDGVPLCWMGTDKHLITYPMQGTKMLNVVLFSSDYSKPMGPEVKGPWVETVPKCDIEAIYADLGSDVKILVDHVTNAGKWYIHQVIPLPSYISGRIVLVGDSAHGMQPHLGSGVGQGFEDIYVLCRLLCHPGTRRSNLDFVLQIYDKLRPRRANMVLEESARVGRIYDGFGKPGQGPEWAANNLAGVWDSIWDHDLKQEVDTALKKLENDPEFKYIKPSL